MLRTEAGNCIAAGLVLRADVWWSGGRPERVKKNGGRKKVTQLSFCMKNLVIGKVSCRRIGFDCIGRSADKWGTFVHKKKSAAESVTPEVLVNPQIQQNSAHPSGNGLYLNLQKIYQIYIV